MRVPFVAVTAAAARAVHAATAVLFVSAVLALSPLPARAAAGTVDLSWDSCAPIVANRNSTVGEPLALYASVIGHDQAHRGYQVWLVLGSAMGTTPDAWQFEEGGCHGLGSVTIDHVTPAGIRACPSFQGNSQSLQIKTFDANAHLTGPEFGSGLRRIILANAYPTAVSGVTSAQRYFLMRVLFDHMGSVAGSGNPGATCGGYETPMCFLMVERKLTWLDSNGVEFPFVIGQSSVTFNDALNATACSGGRVVNRTWGAIKGQYRQ